jgi:hypothetical protein
VIKTKTQRLLDVGTLDHGNFRLLRSTLNKLDVRPFGLVVVVAALLVVLEVLLDPPEAIDVHRADTSDDQRSFLHDDGVHCHVLLLGTGLEWRGDQSLGDNAVITEGY